MVRFRHALTMSFLFKAFLTISKELETGSVQERELSATKVLL